MRVLTASIVVSSLIALGLLWPTTAMAQVQDEEGVVTIYKKTTVLDMKPGKVTGETVVPSASYGLVKKEAQFDLTIRVRQNFLPEVMRTASSL